MPDAANRRQFRRVRIDADARVYSDRAMWPTRCIDVSLKGALIERPKEWSGDHGKTQRLELHHWNVPEAARSMGLSAATLYRYLQRHGLRQGS